MTPEQLVDKLESMGLIDERTLKLIRREVENPNKNASTKSILSYLVKKGKLTSSQARSILAQGAEPKPVVHDDLELNVPEPNYDTDDLTANVGGLAQPSQPTPPPDLSPDADRTRLDMEEEPSTAPVAPPMVPVDPRAPVGHDPLADPMAYDPLAAAPDPYAQPPGYESGPQAAQPHPKAYFPGKRNQANQWQNKWLFIGFGILGTLMILGAVLWFATGLVSAEDRFKAMMESFETGAYKDAINKAEDFLERYPKHEKVPIVKVRRVQAYLADTYNSKNWDETIKRAEQLLPPLVDDETVDMTPIRDDLSYMLPTSALNIAKRALKQPTIEAMKKELEMAMRAKKVVDNPVYIPGTARKKAAVAKLLDELDNTIAAIQGQIRKEEIFDVVLAEIRELTRQQKTDEAFRKYHELTREYGDLAARPELREAMHLVSEAEEQLVTHPDFRPEATSLPRPTPIRQSVILASKVGQPIETLEGEIVPVLADGSVYGVDLAAGTPVWRHHVGYETSIQPEVFDPQTFIMADQRNHDLMRIRRDDGSIVWRLEIGEKFFPPTINEDTRSIVVTTASGMVIKVDPENGGVQGVAKLPQAASTNAAFSSRTPYIYQPGNYSNLYALSSDDLTCQDVFYLGHYPGSITIPPVFWSGYILVAVNGSDTCDLHVLKPTDNGLAIESVQIIRRVTTGPVNSPLMRFGRWMLISADNGDMKILELNTANETSPVSVLAEEKFDTRDGARSWIYAEGSRLWIAGKGIMLYRIQRALGEFNRVTITNHGDYFLGPMRKYGDALIHVRRRAGTAQFCVSAVDARSLKEIWRSDLGGPLAASPWVDGNDFLALTSQGDLISGSLDQTTADQSVVASTISEPLHFEKTYAISDSQFVAVAPADRPDILYINFDSGQTRKLTLQRPADKLACAPVLVGPHLIACSRQGQIMRVDPATGRIVGAPFLPPVKPGVEVNWTAPTGLGSDAVLVADSAGVFYLLSTADPRSLTKIGELQSASTIQSGCVSNGNRGFAVIGSAAGDELVSLDPSNGLKQSGSAVLPAGYASGPWVVGDRVLVRLDNDELICFDQELSEQWTLPLANDQLAADPQLDGGSLVLVFRSGKMLQVNLAAGDVVVQRDWEQPLSQQPVRDSGRLILGGHDGTIHVADESNQ